MEQTVKILGTRGVPASHGGFETFAEQLSLHLVRHGWRVYVYCQDSESSGTHEEVWQGVVRVCVPSRGRGPLSTVLFDFVSIRHALRIPGLNLTLGYNTAVFSALFRLFGRTNVINMDGIEWKRKKWPLPVKLWFVVNEIAAISLATHLIADHPAIATRVGRKRQKVTMIPYGAVAAEKPDPGLLTALAVEPRGYDLTVCRIEPDNGLEQIVRAFSLPELNSFPVVLVGPFDPAGNRFHRRLSGLAGDNIRFVGAIYDREVVAALRHHARFYLHGHTVGGTNPTLVEALAQGCAVLAHDNVFNRWVAQDSARYFRDHEELASLVLETASDPSSLEDMRERARARHAAAFRAEDCLESYRALLTSLGRDDSRQ